MVRVATVSCAKRGEFRKEAKQEIDGNKVEQVSRFIHQGSHIVLILITTFCCSVYLKEEARDFLEPHTIKDLVKKYSQFINFNIYLWTSKTEEVEEPIEEEETKDEDKKEEGDEDKKEGDEDKKEGDEDKKEEEEKDKEDKDDDAEVEEESDDKETKPKTKKVRETENAPSTVHCSTCFV